MFFVPVSWPDYEMACLSPSGRTALAITVGKRVQVLGREAVHGRWRVVREWPQDRLSHTDILVFLGPHPEPESAEDLVNLLKPIDPEVVDPAI